MFIRSIHRHLFVKNNSLLNFERSFSTVLQNRITNKPVDEKQFLVKLKNDPEIFGAQETEDTIDEGDLKEAKFFEERRLPSQKLNTKKYADIIKFLVKRRRIKEAIDVLEVKMLKEDQFKPENYIYNLLLGACGRVGYTKKAFSLYNDMKKRQLKVTGGTYTALFNACANSPYPEDALERAKHLHQIMIEKMYEPNDTNYNAMIKAFGRCGDITTAFNLVDEMLSKKFRIADDTINFLLQACISDKESGFRHALLVWRKMLKMNIKPTLFTYNLILRCIKDCGLGDTDTTKDMFAEILESGESNDIKAIVESSNVLIDQSANSTNCSEVSSNNSEVLTPNLMSKVPHLGNMIAFSGIKTPEHRLLLVGGMKKFIESMRENECAPNNKTFTQLLDIIPSTLAAEQQLLTMMKKNNVKFDMVFFNMLIKKRSMRSDFDNAKKVLRMMQKYDMKPNLITYGVLALGCKTKNEAEEFVQEMKQSKYRLNAEILGALLFQACYSKNFPYIFEIMEMCIKENIQPNKKFIEHLENFKNTNKQLIRSKDKETHKLKSFEKGYRIFRYRYKSWLSEVKIDNSDDVHPWQQFQEESNSSYDKYYEDKEDRFKPRHNSKFRVKTSPKHLNND